MKRKESYSMVGTVYHDMPMQNTIHFSFEHYSIQEIGLPCTCMYTMHLCVCVGQLCGFLKVNIVSDSNAVSANMPP